MLHDDDHRALGHRLGLFHLQEEAAGSVFWHPRGLQLLRALEDHLRRIVLSQGYREVRSPQVLSQPIWERSGHWSVFRQGMLAVEGEARALKPVSCPGHMELVRRLGPLWSDLPLRIAEFGLVHRDEPSGALHGLFRLRQFSQDDGHVFCREDQVPDELVRFVRQPPRTVRGGRLRGPPGRLLGRPPNRLGDDAVWDRAEALLAEAARGAGCPGSNSPEKGAFYGPKLEFVLRDRLGRAWQCGTIQVDLVLPERFELGFPDGAGGRRRPVVLHRALVGSLERFLGILLEHHRGRLPAWLAPEQVVVASLEWAELSMPGTVSGRLEEAGLRVAARRPGRGPVAKGGRRAPARRPLPGRGGSARRGEGVGPRAWAGRRARRSTVPRGCCRVSARHPSSTERRCPGGPSGLRSPLRWRGAHRAPPLQSALSEAARNASRSAFSWSVRPISNRVS